MTRFHRALATLGACLVISLTGAACGGDDGENSGEAESSAPTPEAAEEAEQAVSDILENCITTSFDPSAETEGVSQGVDDLVRLFNAYDPDAPMPDTDLKATNLREALETTRETLEECEPNEADRVSETLTTK